MATVVKETGANVANANSYLEQADVAALIDYHVDYTSWSTASSGDKDNALILAQEYLTYHFRWYSDQANASQALPWPRDIVHDDQGQEIASGTIPDQLKKAQALVALYILRDGVAPQEGSESGALKSWSAGGLSLGFESSKTSSDMTSNLSGTRFSDVEHIVRSIGKFKGDAALSDRRTYYQ